jgi:hypothetical protein
MIQINALTVVLNFDLSAPLRLAKQEIQLNAEKLH